MLNTLLGKIGWSDLPSSFAYTIDKDDTAELVTSVFELRNGTAKTGKTKVTIFSCPNKQANDPRVEIAQRTMRKAKCIKHPSFLSIHEAVSVASGVYIVTDEVRPLSMVAEDMSQRELLISSLPWNLSQIIEGLEFLHRDVGAVHGSLNPDNIFVGQSGQWYIGGLELCFSRDDLSPFTIASFEAKCAAHPKYRMFLEGSGDRGYLPLSRFPKSAPPFCVDRYSFASLAAWASALKSGRPQPWSFDMNCQNLDPSLARVCKRLTNISTANLETFEWKRMITDLGYFTESEIHRTMTMFAGLTLKGNWDKEVFFETTLPDLMTRRVFVDSIWTHLILPHILTQLRAHALPSGLLPKLIALLVRIIALIDSTEYFASVAEPAFVQLMKSPERATRYVLLMNISLYERHISSATAADLFETVCLGMSDSSPELRDVTIRSMLVFIPRVSKQRSLVDRGIKLISRSLHSDSSSQIRTNSVICLAKLATLLSNDVVRTLIAPNLLIGIRDEFPPCRLASLQALGAVSPLMSAQDIALKYLPAISLRLVDSDPECKNVAFSTAEFLLMRLKTLDAGGEDEIETVADSSSLPAMALRMLRNAAWGGTDDHKEERNDSVPTIASTVPERRISPQPYQDPEFSAEEDHSLEDDPLDRIVAQHFHTPPATSVPQSSPTRDSRDNLSRDNFKDNVMSRDNVVSSASRDNVVSSAARDHVVSSAARDHVVSSASRENVVSSASRDNVVLSAAEEVQPEEAFWSSFNKGDDSNPPPKKSLASLSLQRKRNVIKRSTELTNNS